MSLTLQHTTPANSRRGMIPTPDGAIPKPRRARRGHVDLAAWDKAVAADNEANGTASLCDHRQPVEAPATPVHWTDPDTATDASTALPGAPAGAPAMSREAILEPDDDPPADPPAPISSTAATKPAKQPEPPEAFIPPPPQTKAKRQPK